MTTKICKKCHEKFVCDDDNEEEVCPACLEKEAQEEQINKFWQGDTGCSI